MSDISVSSLITAFSIQKAAGINVKGRLWNERDYGITDNIELRSKQALDIDFSNPEVLVDSCVKDRLKRIVNKVAFIARDHSSALEKEATYQRLLAFSKEC